MATREPVSVSIPPPLVEQMRKMAKKHHQPTSELVRAAIRMYLDNVEQEAALEPALAYGRRRARQIGRLDEDQVQALPPGNRTSATDCVLDEVSPRTP